MQTIFCGTEQDRRLLNGESQRKDGKYEFKYQDIYGNRKTIYSWRLTAADRTPAGKRHDLSLREKEKEIQKALNNAVATQGGGMTVIDLVEKYTAQKIGVRQTTRTGYQTVKNMLKKEPFGKVRIDRVKLSDAKQWLIKLQQVDGRSYSSIHNIRGVLRPAFQMAVDDDILLKNPFEFQLHSVVVNDSVKRDAITRKQEREFLEFIKNDKHFNKYYDGIHILFKTGLRISEFVGLVFDNIDFENERIIVNHQLQRTPQMKYIIVEPKTESGIRMIPMTPDVKACFERIVKNRKKLRKEPKIDGYSGFLFLDKNNMPMVAMHWEKYFQHICEKYNKIYKEEMHRVIKQAAETTRKSVAKSVS